MLKLLAILLPCTLLACSLFGQPDSEDAGPPNSTSAAIPPTANSAPPLYNGSTSIEERISSSSAIVRARLTNTTTEVVTTTAEQWYEDYYVAVKYHLSVSEYLHGSGANDVIALKVSIARFATRREAQDAAPTIAADRESRWDDREAVIFLEDKDTNDIFSPLAQARNTYFLVVFGNRPNEDFYSLTSRYDRRWLPVASATKATPGDSQKFLLEEPVAGEAPTSITLGALKTKIAAIVTEINAGDGSEAYKQCVNSKYTNLRIEEWNRRKNPQYKSYPPLPPGSFASGQVAGTELFQYGEGYEFDGKAEKFWISGQDASLFDTKEGPRTPARDSNRNNLQDDGNRFDQYVVSTRPLPKGSYTFNTNLIAWSRLACGHTNTYDVIVKVTAPSRVLHEAFFDPVTVGTAVAADGTNGVLKPAAFTDGNGASATLQRISYEPPLTGSGQTGTVKLTLSPHTGLTGQTVEFIELDGSVSLSLDVADATVDAANGTLSWSVDSQPWEDGDMLMVRIREAR